MTYNLHKVFVYGTLKRGEPNHEWFSKTTNAHYKYLFSARTLEKYPLIIGTKYNIPFVLYSPGNGTHVRGEVYEVDEQVLSHLDTLENHPNYYIRDLYDVKPLINESDTDDKVVKAWMYVIKNFKKELLEQPFYETYSNSGSHGKKYVPTQHRDKSYNLRAETFASYSDS